MAIDPIRQVELTQHDAYAVEMLGTVPPEVVESLKAELLSIGTRYGLVPKVRLVSVAQATKELVNAR